jgi:hypothetical protein
LILAPRCPASASAPRDAARRDSGARCETNVVYGGESAFVSAGVRGAGAVVVSPSVRKGSLGPGSVAADAAPLA